MNTIILDTGSNQRTFTDSTILDGNIFVSNSPIGESLETDEFNFTVIADNFDYQSFAPKGYDLLKTSDGKIFCTSKTYQRKITLTPYGTSCIVKHGTQTIGKFFVRKVTQKASNQFYVECISAVGLLSYIDHYGGVYGVDSACYVTDLIEDIIGDMPCTISDDFDTMMIQGYLPIASARDNLQQVLFAVGGAIIKDSSGNLEIKYNQPESATVLSDSSIYQGAEINNLTKATKVTLIEHSYFKGETTSAEDLYDNLDDITTVVNQKITFSQPYYDYHAYDSSGTEISSFIVESGENYVIIGTSAINKGRVTGKPYIHSQRTLVKSTGVTSVEANEITVSDATLVSPYNSTNCLERLASYYSEANEVNMDIVYGSERSGTLLQFTDFYGGDDKVGYVKSLDIALSNTLKASSKMAVDWTPNHLGNTYNAYTIVDKARLGALSVNAWTPTDDDGNSLVGKEAYVVLFSGADGGQGGYNGSDGTGAGSSASMKSYRYHIGTSDYYQAYEPSTAGQGGTGGNGGEGGNHASRFNSAIMTLGQSYAIQLGAGGSGGTANGGTGGSGGHTTFGSLSSDEHDLTGSYVNIVDQSVYCKDGTDGTKGGNGGNGGAVSTQQATSQYANNGTQGGSAGQKTGGAASSGAINLMHNNDTGDDQLSWYLNVGGGGGGGASADANGSAAGSPSGVNVAWYQGSSGNVWILQTDKGGNGGNGASATTQPTQSTLGQGGQGGNGGGGGGGAGAGCSNNPLPSIFSGDMVLPATGGTGGTGSQGGQGSDGFIIIYFNND